MIKLQTCLGLALSHQLICACHQIHCEYLAQLHNLVVAPNNTAVWLLDFEHSCLGDPDELKWERESLLDLLDLELGSNL